MQENLDVLSFLENTEHNFTLVKEAAALDADGSVYSDVFSIMASKVRFIRIWWESVNAATVASLGIVTGDGMGEFPIEHLDDNWLKDVLGVWNE